MHRFLAGTRVLLRYLKELKIDLKNKNKKKNPNREKETTSPQTKNNGKNINTRLNHHCPRAEGKKMGLTENAFLLLLNIVF